MAETDQQDRILDLSGQGLKKFNKVQPQDIQGVTTLVVDGNELQRWDNIDGYSGLKKLSASHNQLLRMYGVSRLQHLCSLNLAHNSILTIEGLKDLVHLKWLCLAANNIKTIEHLHTNIHLEHLDLSENSITHISDISFLKNLKQLFLHGNRISQLRQCERYLPSGLVTLTLASNNICDLNEISHLVHLVNLREFSIMGNPCVNMTGNCVGFDYRPFVINWCMSLKVIDGFMVDAIESLKAEWLYSQGRGRQFRVGEHAALVQYLATVCPLSSDTLESEDERKLRLILSKAQQHQQQLREQVTTSGSIRGRGTMLNRSQSSPAPSPAARRKVSSHRHTSPRRGNMLKESKLPMTERHDRGKSPDRMAASCQLAPEGDVDVPVLMTQSLDPCLLFSNSTSDTSGIGDSTDRSSTHLGVEETNSELSNSCPLQAASKLVPVPESLMSPDYRPVQPVVTRVVRPRASTVSTVNGPALRGNGSAQGSPKLCRSLHSSPRSRTRSMVEPRRMASTRGPSDHRPSRKRYGPPGTRDGNSSDEDSEMSASKLETIRHRAQERWQRKDTVPASATSMPAISTGDFQYDDLERAEQAAVCIQKMWRGYYTRNINPEVQSVYRQILDMRTQQYIRKLSADMEATKAALETDRRLHALKMQAINAIWKKVLSIQSQANATQEAASCSSQKSESEAIRELTQTCSLLHSQLSMYLKRTEDVGSSKNRKDSTLLKDIEWAIATLLPHEFSVDEAEFDSYTKAANEIVEALLLPTTPKKSTAIECLNTPTLSPSPTLDGSPAPKLASVIVREDRQSGESQDRWKCASPASWSHRKSGSRLLRMTEYETKVYALQKERHTTQMKHEEDLHTIRIENAKLENKKLMLEIEVLKRQLQD